MRRHWGRGPALVPALGMAVLAACGGTSLEGISVGPDASVAKGLTVQLEAFKVFDDGTRAIAPEAQWSSADPSIVTVDANGVATGAGVGEAVVTASYGGKQGSAKVTVNPARLVTMQIAPAGAVVRQGSLTRLAAIGTYTDATTRNITADAVWTSSATRVIDVRTGIAAAFAVGSAVVSASVGEVRGSTTVVVAAGSSEDVGPPPTATLTLIPDVLIGGNPSKWASQAIVTLSAPATHDVQVVPGTSHPLLLALPGPFVIPAGETTGTFVIEAPVPVGGPTTVEVTVTLDGATTASATLTVKR